MSEPDSGSVAEPEALSGVGGTSPRQAAKQGNRALRWIIEVVVIVAAAFVLALLVQHFIVKPFAIPSPSMEPTLVEGDRVLVNRMAYHFREPRKGDVVVFHPPARPGSDPFIKRVVGVAGDTVAVRDGVLWLNGAIQEEPYLREYPIVGDLAEVTIEPGHVWVMGDNRNNSGDSRVFGQVSTEAIMGEAFAIYWPLSHIGRL